MYLDMCGLLIKKWAENPEDLAQNYCWFASAYIYQVALYYFVDQGVHVLEAA